MNLVDADESFCQATSAIPRGSHSSLGAACSFHGRPSETVKTKPGHDLKKAYWHL